MAAMVTAAIVGIPGTVVAAAATAQMVTEAF
jgi:hypothetical protein